jgi:cell division protease FtsH
MFGPLALWLALLIGAVGISHYSNFRAITEHEFSKEHGTKVDFSTFLEAVEHGQIVEVYIKGLSITGYDSSKRVFYTRAPVMSYELVKTLLDRGVKVRAYDPDSFTSSITDVVTQWTPMLLIGVAIYMFVRRRRGEASGLFGLGLTGKAKDARVPNVSFKDVAGVDEAKESLQEVVDFLKNPAKFRRLGAVVPRGVLLYGPPGTGKTLLARCVAGESNAAFMYASGAAFVEVYVGMGAQKIRKVFEQVRARSPCILFIDEIDAVAASRRVGTNAGDTEHAQTLTQLLEEMDGFEQHKDKVYVVIAATNRPEVLDPAISRRFARQIPVNLPDYAGRKAIIDVCLKAVKYDTKVDIDRLAVRTIGFSGADIKTWVNESTLLATQRNDKHVGMTALIDGLDIIRMGAPARREATEYERRTVAYHETGHAVAAMYTENSYTIDKVTIIPRRSALGMLVQMPKSDDRLRACKTLIADIVVGLAGRAAEELVFGVENVTDGASSDLRAITHTACVMAFELGMCVKDGKIVQSGKNMLSFKYDNYLTNTPPQALKERLEEAEKIVEVAYQQVKDLLTKHRALMDRIVKELFARETLTKDELWVLADGKDLPPLALSTEPKKKRHRADGDISVADPKKRKRIDSENSASDGVAVDPENQPGQLEEISETIQGI